MNTTSKRRSRGEKYPKGFTQKTILLVLIENPNGLLEEEIRKKLKRELNVTDRDGVRRHLKKLKEGGLIEKEKGVNRRHNFWRVPLSYERFPTFGNLFMGSDGEVRFLRSEYMERVGSEYIERLAQERKRVRVKEKVDWQNFESRYWGDIRKALVSLLDRVRGPNDFYGLSSVLESLGDLSRKPDFPEALIKLIKKSPETLYLLAPLPKTARKDNVQI